MVVNATYVDVSKNAIVNGEVVLVFQWIMFAVVCQVVDVFGVVSNTINIICFVKQGFKDPVNVSLLGLAVSDLGCLITIMWTNICFVPAVATADLGFDPIEFQYLTSAVPHATFTRITSWITALVTLERCLCITAPLKIKSIVTSKRVSIIITCVFVLFISSTAPIYAVNTLGLKYFPSRNKTMLGLFYTQDREEVEKISFAINNIFLPFTAFMVIIVCTIIIVVKLRKATKWRLKSTSGEQTMSNRNQKVAKMVVIISTLFIACFVPLCIFFIAMSFEPELSVSGKYKQILLILSMFIIFLDSINSSVNIVVYYRMSSKFKTVLGKLFKQKQ